MRARLVASLALVLGACTSEVPPPSESATRAPRAAIAWQPWTPAVLERARAENRLVLLDLGTVWCHWCHVMEETTYADPTVIALVDRGFVAIKVDADARPDLANRYEDYGWPATILFDSKGTELAKFRGYLSPARMASLLRGFMADPTPGPSALAAPVASVAPASSSVLPEALRASLLERHLAGWDEAKKGWGTSHKFLDPESLELSLRQALAGDALAAERARATLELERTKLIDPAWGGVYQYSDSGDWEHPHFEKIMGRQASDMELFALASEQLDSKEDLDAARKIERYLIAFLASPEGTFFASQDADLVPGEHAGEYFALDDAARRAKGIPRIDDHVYARENGWAIEALASLAMATGDETTLARAVKAAERIQATHSVAGGGFKHDAKDDALYLGDTLAMARAFWRLYLATAQRRFLERAVESVRFADATFAGDAGYLAAKRAPGVLPQLDENVQLARLANLLDRATAGSAAGDGVAPGEGSLRAIAERAMRFVAAPDATARRGFYTAGVLLADLEMRREPLHVTVSGDPARAETRALLAAARRIPTSFIIIETAKGDEPAAMLCGDGVCRPPVSAPADLLRVARELLHDEASAR